MPLLHRRKSLNHDSGSGARFNSRSIPDPTAPENQLSAHGRGIYLMRASMDEIHFEEDGVVVLMRKRPNANKQRFVSKVI
jgi:anti-sigma regulatory factor (Ser/Thr protein kinase)